MDPTNNPAPAVKPANLENISTENLIAELYRRTGEVVLMAVTPLDLSDHWGSDENGNPYPGNVLPNPVQWAAARRAFERWQDCGAFTEAMEAMGDAWADEVKKGGGK